MKDAEKSLKVFFLRNSSLITGNNIWLVQFKCCLHTEGFGNQHINSNSIYFRIIVNYNDQLFNYNELESKQCYRYLINCF